MNPYPCHTQLLCIEVGAGFTGDHQLDEEVLPIGGASYGVEAPVDDFDESLPLRLLSFLQMSKTTFMRLDSIKWTDDAFHSLATTQSQSAQNCIKILPQQTYQESSEADVVAKLILHELSQPVVLGTQGVHPQPDFSPTASGQALLDDIAGAFVAAELHNVVPQLGPDKLPATGNIISGKLHYPSQIVRLEAFRRSAHCP